MTAAPFLFLLDETAPPAGLPILREALRQLRCQGGVAELLSIPCPTQPSHPLPDAPRPYRPWLYAPLPPHELLLAVDPAAVLVAAAYSDRPVVWLIHESPCPNAPPGGPAECSQTIRSMDGIYVLATAPALASTPAPAPAPPVWPLLPVESLKAGPPAGVPAPPPGTPVVAVDHTGHEADTLITAAEALAGLTCRRLLLTDLLDPPCGEAFDEIRIRPRNRCEHYRRADLILKLDSLRMSAARLFELQASQAALAISGAAAAGLPIEHGQTAWILSGERSADIHKDVRLLLEHDGLRKTLADAARVAAQAAAAEPPAVPDILQEWQSNPSVARPLPLAGLLAHAERRLWNTTILRLLADRLDAASSGGRPRAQYSWIRRPAATRHAARSLA